MNGWTPIIVAGIGALTAITGSFLTTSATVDGKINQVDTKVQVLQERQELQYKELKDGLGRIEMKLDKALK